MDIRLLADMNWESKLDHAMKVVDCYSLLDVDYGPGLNRLVIVMCRDPNLGFKQRVRLAKATRTLSMDVMLDLPYFVQAKHSERRSTVYEQLMAQVSAVLEKRRLKEFDTKRFLRDFDSLLKEQLTGENSTRFDSFCLERATGF
ncbi:hypothetical protein [Massilia scottii]|uniref:hypothetical protein n=1 Tax=Massilia scottii TaxID=3057166 RepID=UPI002796CE02|nr:hypothetical protein [Massilia sp. CCM 9029]MDQ1832145.1 hypothetical protein [Massilia sp. CCM 9029]